ncbi:unnamed protein product [Lathyrus oleraceus]
MLDATKSERERRPTSSYYFTSFPEKLQAMDIYKVFKEYGDVDEVVVLAKRNKRGKKFGFVRFFEVMDEKNLAVKLDSIFLGRALGKLGKLEVLKMKDPIQILQESGLEIQEGGYPSRIQP